MTRVAGLALLGFALALPAEAQQTARFASTATDVAQAAQLEAEAQELYNTLREYKRAAKLHMQAAALRPASDAKRVDNLRMAAMLYHYAGRLTNARQAMTQAGDAALAAGDVKTAADSYLDAAFLSSDEGVAEEANRLVRKAQLLTHSPLLTSQARNSILRRISA